MRIRGHPRGPPTGNVAVIKQHTGAAEVTISPRGDHTKIKDRRSDILGSHAHARRPSSVAASVPPPCNEPPGGDRRRRQADDWHPVTDTTASDNSPAQPMAATAAALPADHPRPHPALHVTHQGKVERQQQALQLRMDLRPRIRLQPTPSRVAAAPGRSRRSPSALGNRPGYNAFARSPGAASTPWL